MIDYYILCCLYEKIIKIMVKTPKNNLADIAKKKKKNNIYDAHWNNKKKTNKSSLWRKSIPI